MAAVPSRSLLVLGFALALLVTSVPTASCATFAVNITPDVVDANPGDGICETGSGNGLCSLRAAILEANALPGADTVTLPAGTYKITQAIVFFPGDTGQLLEFEIGDDLSIVGAGSGVTLVDGSCDTLDPYTAGARVFHVTPTAVVSISDVTVRNGCSVARGGGIYNEGTLTLTDSVVRDNKTQPFFVGGSGVQSGAGIGNAGTLLVRRTTISGNLTFICEAFACLGGGILNQGVATIEESTISDNSAAFGGGIYSNSMLTVQNSTISGNVAGGFAVYIPGLPPWLLCTSGGYGGGIFGGGTLAYTTVAGNTALTGQNVPTFCGPGGGAGLSGSFTLDSSIVQNGSPAPITDCDGTMTSSGYNIAGDASCAFAGPADLNATDALLGPLATNGGPTMTRRLLAGSPAIDSANGATCPATDQRGVLRPFGAGCDRGAFEDTGLCGNGTVDAGETCDDGNPFGGDCCSATCQLEVVTSPCTDDGDVCTDDFCDGAGSCTHPHNAAPCSDGNPCTMGDLCSGGTCIAGPPVLCGPCHVCDGTLGCTATTGNTCDDGNACTAGDTCADGACTGSGVTCDPCEVCDPIGGCAVPATAGCQAAAHGGARVVLVNSSDDPKDVLIWRWRSSGTVTPADFGNPTGGTGYRLCVVDDGALALSLGIPSGGAWASAANGWKLVDPAFPPEGLLRMRLKATAAGKGTIALRRRRGSIGDPGLPFDLPLTVRLLRSDAPTCWESTASTATRNANGRFRATSD
jgi:CSLREA domain-containing protein